MWWWYLYHGPLDSCRFLAAPAWCPWSPPRSDGQKNIYTQSTGSFKILMSNSWADAPVLVTSHHTGQHPRAASRDKSWSSQPLGEYLKERELRDYRDSSVKVLCSSTFNVRICVETLHPVNLLSLQSNPGSVYQFECLDMTWINITKDWFYLYLCVLSFLRSTEL